MYVYEEKSFKCINQNHKMDFQTKIYVVFFLIFLNAQARG